MKKLMVRLLALTLILAGLVAAQERKWQQKVFDIRNADAQALARLVQGVMRDRDTRVIDNGALKAISVGSYEANDLQAAEELIKRFDVPRGESPTGAPRNIEVVAYMVLAGKTGTVGDAVPAELDGVVKQLKAVFGYSDYRLMDTAVLRVREGQTSDSSGNAGMVDPNLPSAPWTYQMKLKATTAQTGPKGNVLRIDGFRFGLRIPYVSAGTQSFQSGQGAPIVTPNWNYTEVGFSTDLDIREGQKVVVGKSKVDRSGNAFILVLTAKAVD
ncbi:hypothetical protein [Paludibaculum fermentans]|uniref:NolW-like domain-containing protein n=1 Tax=Paludibaculum fermentans TaxID=1473598 RepID=A0A7S7NXT2_PALFE|nr:hypothetical protein [Paludibaculum fermentans]QOY91740.1 hypothetical protein IRI77_17900 [Paludibaculum fermentans]